MDKYDQLQQQIDELKYLLNKDSYSNLEIYRKPVQFEFDLIFSTRAGSMIGTSPDQKIAVYGATPIIQQDAIVTPSGGGTIDSQSRTAIVSIITALKNFGIISI